MACTCSLCVIKGCLWIVPPEGRFNVIRDDGYLKEYASKAISNKFCSYCGTGVLGQHLVGPTRGQTMVNIRAIQGVNPFQIESNITTIETEDERDRQEPASSELSAPHVFSCHCGNLRVELDVSIHDQEFKEDNCSLCVRNAYIGVYPTKDQARVHGREHSFEYYGIKAESTGRRWSSTVYCQTCGVFTLSVIYGPPINVFDKLAPERKAHALEVYYKNINLLPLNVRALKGFQTRLFPKSIDIQRSDEGTEGYKELLEPWRGGD
ncbi:glutathione-dependent formaldehyde-activating gfa [Hirsutella rhossiliensis]|uniref:Glutathione-dependent formaldehyde-activating gfa n=1 Tax=Hirsutella rhossiliensis TaxID=111463 RepID=A0A9P8SEA1_9HYPO|nr:glutathione-dependent formaldehyde-activating gfa [Hirsutella rhossiliensis]KAH0959461.1 glutathione-dependent formaldehyde-activating gfa [Hirsutella rhossiliensis]